MPRPVRFIALPTDLVRAWRADAPDANGMAPERTVSDGGGNPCRHCLNDIPEGRAMLILAHRPFPALQPYAETGPIFVCGDECRRWKAEGLPPVLASRPAALVKGYGADDRIVYGSGCIVPGPELLAAAAALFEDPRVRYGHVRSATNNCYTCRISPA